ncbi:MAG: hypothetical protein JKY50_07215 [Oleispira sp.]|nr:hypothetical protein [Oleispira sp.]
MLQLTPYRSIYKDNRYKFYRTIFSSLGLLGKRLLVIFLGFLIPTLATHAEDVILRHSFAGNISFELTGNSLRDSIDTCSLVAGGQSSGNISLPSNASIKAAYLYWSGSGGIDTQVTFNGQPVNSQTNYTELFNGRNYFSEKADVTQLVSNNTFASYRVSGLTFDGSDAYCSTGGAYGGWALAIIFEHPNEPLRVINVFDGFKNFWGEQFELIPNNFVIASNPSALGGKHAHITWEGDEGNSQQRNNEVESLTFENRNLTDPNNPSNNQFNGYSNVIGATSGVDIDEYQIGNFLIAGATRVHTRYSSGQDAVFLTAEFISVPNESVADLTIQQSGPANIIRGQQNTFGFTVTNNGPNTAPQNSQFSFNIPQGFSFVTTPNPSWSCSTISDTLDCLYLDDITASNSSMPLSLVFIVDKTAGSNDSVNISGTIKGLLFDNILSNNTSLSSYLIQGPDITTSIKEVVDLNGGNVNPGDTLRYTITITESAGIAVSGISLTDHLSAEFSTFEIISLPADAINNSLIAPAGDFNSGLIQIDNISVTENGSQTLVIDVILSASLPTGTEINNSVELTSSATETLTINAPSVFSAQAINPSAGNKHLYLHSNSSVGRPNQIMRRNRPTVTSNRNIGRNNKDAIWTLEPNFQSQFEFSGTSIDLNLCLQSNQNSSKTHTMKIQLLHNSTVIADSDPITITIPSKNSPVEQFAYTIPLTQSPIIPAGDTLKLRIINITGAGGIRVYSLDGADYCYVSIPAKTVINVDSILAIDSATSLAVSDVNSGSDISIETVISDPFGSFDITSADLSATDAEGNSIFINLPMTLTIDSLTATKTFSLDYSIPANTQAGYWKFSVRAKEGEENTIEHSSDFMLLINQALPNLKLEKSIEIFSDPINGINGTNNFSKAVPGAIFTYSIQAINTGLGAAENNSIWISDAIPDKTYMLVKDFNDISGQGPVIEQPVNPTSGLSYQFFALDSSSDDIEFSENNGLSFDYSPLPDSDGVDKKITHFRINPNGTLQAPAAGESSNTFSIKFRVQLQ